MLIFSGCEKQIAINRDFDKTLDRNMFGWHGGRMLAATLESVCRTEWKICAQLYGRTHSAIKLDEAKGRWKLRLCGGFSLRLCFFIDGDNLDVIDFDRLPNGTQIGVLVAVRKPCSFANDDFLATAKVSKDAERPVDLAIGGHVLPLRPRYSTQNAMYSVCFSSVC
jgi:hypothetical protein